MLGALAAFQADVTLWMVQTLNLNLTDAVVHLQPLLLLAALAAVPWMLVPKPYVLRKRHMERHQHDVSAVACRQSLALDGLELVVDNSLRRWSCGTKWICLGCRG